MIEKESEDMTMRLVGKLGFLAGGFLLGTAGVKILGSDDAKKVYTECTAAVLRAKDCILERKDILQENVEDIYADAEAINAKRAAAKREKEYEDAIALVKACEEEAAPAAEA